VRVGYAKLAVGRDDLDLDDVVAREPQRAGRVSVAAPEAVPPGFRWTFVSRDRSRTRPDVVE
jgi:hypothetical protein